MSAIPNTPINNIVLNTLSFIMLYNTTWRANGKTYFENLWTNPNTAMPTTHIPTPTANMFKLVINVPIHVMVNPHATLINIKFSFFICYTIHYFGQWVKMFLINFTSSNSLSRTSLVKSF
jgi:hypothetical protein